MRVFEATPASFAGNCFTVATLLTLFSAALLAPVFALVALVVTIFLPVLMITICSVLVGSLFLPWREERPAFRNFFLFRHWRSFFALKVVVEEPCPKKGLYACFPHGVFPLVTRKVMFFFFIFLLPQGLLLAASVSGVLFPGRKTKGAIASVFFWIPLLGNLLSWFGCVPADSSKISALLRSENLVFLLPEGIAGVFQTSWQQ